VISVGPLSRGTPGRGLLPLTRATLNTPMKRTLAIALIALLTGACGASPSARTSPVPLASPSATSSPLGSPSPSPSPTPAPSPAPSPSVTAGAPAYIAVSVATGWHSPQSPRAVDNPALENPVRIEAWLAGMSAADKVGLIGRVDSQMLFDETVKVLKLQSGWARVVVPGQSTPLDSRGYPVWIPLRQLTAAPPPDASETAMVVTPTTWLRSPDGTLRHRVSFGTVMPVLGEASTTYEVSGPGGVMFVDKAAVSTQNLPKTAASIIATARSFIGLPYLWGGTSGFGYDCSGLVYALFKAHGILLPRDAGPQALRGVPVSRTDLQAGDLVFFSSGGVVYHVAIYAGQGFVVDSPSPGHPVEQVPLSTFPVIGDYSGARRVLPAVGP
jgi:gamma-D-glutamyl-L-lysine dipeptidyl-peptidase